MSVTVFLVKFFALLWLVILLGLSGFTFMSAGGSFASLNFESQDSYANWPISVCTYDYANAWFNVIPRCMILLNKVCATSPYTYLRPFSFTSSAGSSPSYCGFPNSNSEFRFIVSSVAIVHVIILYFNTPLSLLAKPSLGMYIVHYLNDSLWNIIWNIIHYDICIYVHSSTFFHAFIHKCISYIQSFIQKYFHIL